MTIEELCIVRAVLNESARLSTRDAEALTLEIARRCERTRCDAVSRPSSLSETSSRGT